MSGAQAFWAIAIGFLAGVFFRSLVPFGWWGIGFLLLLGGSALLVALFEDIRKPAGVLAGIALLSCAAGAMRLQTAVFTGDPVLNTRIGQSVVLDGIVSDEPDARETSTLVHVAVHSSGAAGTPVSAGVLVILPAHALVRYGDTVRIEGVLKLPETFDTGLGRQFNYPEYLAMQGIGYEVSFARLDTRGNAGNPLKAAAFAVKKKYLEGTRAVLPEPESGLAGGITVGDKRSIGPELSAVFQRDSLIHMVVLSGYNITVVLNTVARALQGAPQVLRFGGSIGVVAFFIVMSGGASSATRSGLMALIAVFARATHRTYLGGRALVAVAVLMVAWNPLILVFDPSFQLSALATLGLVLLTPVFSVWFARVPERFGAREILASTCATQLMVLPLLLYQNGTLSLVALPANLFALAPVPLAMLASFIAALAGMALGTLGAVLALPAYALLWYVIGVAQFFSSFPFAAVSLPAFSAWWTAAAYALLMGGVIFFRRRYRSSVSQA